MVTMTDISPAAAAARESARTGSGRFGEQEHSAPELTLVTPTKESDPRYEAGVSEHDDDMTDEEWFEAYGPAEAVPFVFDKDYRNDEQVRPYMADFLRVHDEIEAAGQYPYNDSFKGRIPSLAGTDSKNEDTAIYMLQNLRRLDIEAATRAEFVEAGGRKVTADDIAPGQTLRGTVVHSGFYVGGTGWEVHEDVRLRVRVYPNGNRSLEFVEKGKRNGSLISGGDVYFKES